jgi:hypothetical protein
VNNAVQIANQVAVTQTQGACEAQEAGAFQLPHGTHQAGAVESAAGCYGAQLSTRTYPAVGAVDRECQPKVVG